MKYRKVDSESSVISKETLSELRQENDLLMQKLSSMKQTWIAHLDMLLDSQTVSVPSNSTSVSPTKRKKSKLVKPVRHSGIKRVMNALTELSFLLSYIMCVCQKKTAN